MKLAVLLLLCACTAGAERSPAQLKAEADVARMAEVVQTAIADGAVTPEESSAIRLELARSGASVVAAAPPPEPHLPPWVAEVGRIAGSLALTYFGLKVGGVPARIGRTQRAT